MKIFKKLSLFLLFFSLNILAMDDEFDLGVDFDEGIPTYFEPEVTPEEQKEIISKQEALVYIPFFGHIRVSKSVDINGKVTWKTTVEDAKKVIKIGKFITFDDFDAFINKDKKLEFVARANFNGTIAKISLIKSKFDVKRISAIKILSAEFKIEFLEKNNFKILPGFNLTVDKGHLILEKEKFEASIDIKNMQIPVFANIEKATLKLTAHDKNDITLSMEGNGTLNFPGNPPVPFKLGSSINKNKEFILTTVVKDILYKDIKIQKAKIFFNTSTKEIKIKGVSNILGSYVKVKVTRDSSGRWQFKGTLRKDTIFSIPLLSGRKIIFNNAKVALDPADQLIVKAISRDKDIQASLTLTLGKRSSARVEIQNILLQDLVPGLQDSKAGSIDFKTLEGTLTSPTINLFDAKINQQVGLPGQDSEDEEDVDLNKDIPEIDFNEFEASKDSIEISFKAKANLSSIVPEMQNLDVIVTGNVGPKIGFNLTADINNFEVPYFGKVSNSKVFMSLPACGVVALDKKKGDCPGLTIGFSGSGEADLPEIGKFKYTLGSSFEKGGLVFKAAIGDFTYSGLKIEKASVVLNTKTGDFEIVGDTNLNNINFGTKRNPNINDIKVKIRLAHATSKASKDKKYYAVSGEIVDPVKPLKNIDVTLLNGKLELNHDDPNMGFSIAGDVKLENHVLSSKTTYMRKAKAEILSIKTKLFEATPDQKYFTMSNIFTVLKNTPFHQLRMTTASLEISSDTYTDEATGDKVSAGISFSGDFDDFISPLGSVKSVLSDLKTKAKVLGSLNFQDIQSSFAGIKFDVGLKDKNSSSAVRSGSATLMISAKPSMSLGFKIDLDIDPTQKALSFSFNLELDVLSNIEISGDMGGCWKNPLGIKAVSVCEMGLSLGINPVTFFATGLPSGFGAKGYIEVPGTNGKKRFIIAFSVNSTNPKQQYFVGELDGELSLAEVVGFAYELAAGVVNQSGKAFAPGKKPIMPNSINLKNVPLLSIKDVLVKVVPPGAAVTIGEEIYDPGMAFRGKMNIFGKNALIDIQTNETGCSGKGYLEKVEIKDFFLLTGAGPDKKIGTSDDGAIVDIALNPTDQHVAISGRLEIGPEKFRIFKADTNIYISVMEGLKFSQEINLFDQFKVAAKVSIPGVQDVLKDKDALKKASIDLLFKNDFNDNAKKAILNGLKDAQKVLQQAANDANTALDKAKQDIIAAKNRDAKAALDKLEKEYNDAVKKWNSFSGFEKSYRWADVGSKIAGLKTAVEVGRNTYKPILGATQDVVDVAARQVATNTLKGTNLIVQVGGRFVVASGLLDTLAINEIKFHGSLGELENGIMPRLDVVFTLMGKKYNFVLNFDFKKADESFEKLGKAIGAEFEKIFKK